MKYILLSLSFSFLMMSCSSNFSPYTSLSQGSLSGGNQPSSTNPQMLLSWKANLGEQQGFNIEQSTDGANYAQIQSVPDGVNSLKVNVTKGKNYYFRVRGYNQVGLSAYSSIVMGSL